VPRASATSSRGSISASADLAVREGGGSLRLSVIFRPARVQQPRGAATADYGATISVDVGLLKVGPETVVEFPAATVWVAVTLQPLMFFLIV
jgi:hypothetical protein